MKILNLLTLLMLLHLSFIAWGQSNDLTKQVFDFEITITNEGAYIFNQEEIKLKQVKNLIKNHLKRTEALRIKLNLENRVRYDLIEKFRKSYERYLIAPQDQYVLAFNDLGPKIQKENQYKYFIDGKIVDSQNKPLKNISVILKGTQTGQVSGQDGSFKLGVPPASKALVFVGKEYDKLEIDIENLDTLSNTSNFIVTLDPK